MGYVDAVNMINKKNIAENVQNIKRRMETLEKVIKEKEYPSLSSFEQFPPLKKETKSWTSIVKNIDEILPSVPCVVPIESVVPVEYSVIQIGKQQDEKKPLSPKKSDITITIKQDSNSEIITETRMCAKKVVFQINWSDPDESDSY